MSIEHATPQSRFTQEAGSFLAMMDEMAPELRLDYSVDSLQRLEHFISEHFDPPGSHNVSDVLKNGIGCYFGEIIVRKLDGYWNEADRPAIEGVGNLEPIYPIEISLKRFEQGASASILWAYHGIVKQAHQSDRPEAQQHADAPHGDGEGLLSRLLGFFRN